MNEITKQAIFELCTKKKEVFILDTFNYIFKYHFSHKDLSVIISGKEVPTGHLYGFLKNLLFLKEHFPDSAVILAIDGKDMSRSEINPEYKADRHHDIEPMDDMSLLMSFCSLVDGVYACYDANYEADDIVCSISRQIKGLCDKHNIEKKVYILSSDKDMYQLITDDGPCTICAVKKWGYGEDWFNNAEIINVEGVLEAFNGVAPEDLVKFRALTGDPSDNLKGYYRFFKKNAAIIAQNFDYDREKKMLVLKVGCEMHQSWQKFLPKVLEDMSIFSTNYEIMLMKVFDYELYPIYQNLTDIQVKEIMDNLKLFKMYSYMSLVSGYSPYKDIINAYMDEDTQVDEDCADDIIAQDIGSLLE